MPKKRPISQYLGQGRGAFKKALLSVLLDKHSEDETFELAKKELGNKCIYCGVPDEKQLIQPDFLWIQANGGLFKIGNIVPACPTCNSNRGSKNWEVFIKDNDKIKEEEKRQIITKIKHYMKKYDMDTKPSIEDHINEKDRKTIDEFKLLLHAITQGVRAEIGNPQTRAVKFKEPKKLFREFVNIAKKYCLNK